MVNELYGYVPMRLHQPLIICCIRTVTHPSYDFSHRRKTMLKQVQAGRLLGSSLRQLADLHFKLKCGTKAQGAEMALKEAVEVLQV